MSKIKENIRVSVSCKSSQLIDKPVKESELRQRFLKEYNERFFGKAIVSDEYLDNMSFMTAVNCTSRNQIQKWINNWISKNVKIPTNFITDVNKSIDVEFKNIIDQENAGRWSR